MHKLLTAAKVIGKVAQAIHEDATAAYGLKEPFTAHYTGPGVGLLARNGFLYHEVTVGVLTISSGTPDTCLVTIQPFPASAGLWNGPNLIPNDWGDGSMEASLVHDVIWSYSEAIAAKINASPESVRRWADGLLVATWRNYGGDGLLTRIKTWVAYCLCPVGSWLRAHGLRIPAVIVALGLSGAMFMYGCSTPPPDWHMEPGTPEPVYVAAIEAGEVAND